MINKEIKFLPKREKELKRKLKKNVNATVIDTHMYKDSVADIEMVRDKLFENNKKDEFVEQLTEDLFHCLYKVNPEINHEKDVVEEQRLSHQVLSSLVKSENFEKLRANTVANLFNSTLSLSSVQEQAMKTIDEYTKRNKELKDMMKKISEAKKTRNRMDDLQNQGKDSSKTKEKLDNLLNDIDNSMANTQFDLVDMVDELTKGLSNTTDTLNGVNSMLDGFGGQESSQVRKLPYNEKIALAKAVKNSHKFKDLHEQLGRMNQMVNKVGKKPSPYGHTICDIGIGANLPKVLSSELINLTDRDLENNFYKKYSNKTLLEFKTDGQEDGRGPIVICLDESGSMTGVREVWSKAFCVACIQLASRQKRNCKVIIFSNRVKREFEFDKKKLDINKLVDFVEYFSRGGTNYDEPLEMALKTIEESKYKKADILFVTDGEPSSDVDTELIKKINIAKEVKNFRVQSVLIGSGVSSKSVKPFSDSFVRISDLSNDGMMMDVFENIQS